VSGRVTVRRGRLDKLTAGGREAKRPKFSLEASDPGRLDVTIADARVAPGAKATLVSVYTDQTSFSFFLRDVSPERPILVRSDGVALVTSDDDRDYETVEAEILSQCMTRDQITSEVEEAFGHVPRPNMFIRGTCTCPECLEHEATMQTFTPDDLPLDKLNNAGWDPICFASDEAFAFFMPGLVKLVLEHADDYVQQFVFHVGYPDQLAAYTPEQARAIANVLDFLLIHEDKALYDNLAVHDLCRTREKLGQVAEDNAPDRAP